MLLYNVQALFCDHVRVPPKKAAMNELIIISFFSIEFERQHSQRDRGG